MRQVRLGRTGVEVSAVSLGTWPYGGPNTLPTGMQVGWTGHDPGQARAAMRAAWEAGIRHWDTADVYGPEGDSERQIGAMWGYVPRDDIFLASKVGWDPGPHGHFYEPSHMRAKLERSLTNLQVERIDLCYLHHCQFGPSDEHFDEALAAVRRFQEEGKVRFIGLSDWDADRIMQFIERVDPDVVQPYRNVLDDKYVSSGLRSWVDDHDLGVAFFSPLRHGLLLGKYDAPTTFSDGDFRNNVDLFTDASAVSHIREAAAAVRARFAAAPAPVVGALVGAVLSDAPTGCALVGLRTPEPIAAAVATAGAALSAQDAAWVRETYAI